MERGSVQKKKGKTQGEAPASFFVISNPFFDVSVGGGAFTPAIDTARAPRKSLSQTGKTLSPTERVRGGRK